MTQQLRPSQIAFWPLDRLKPYARNAKTHHANQVAKIAASMAEFGYPVFEPFCDSGTQIVAAERTGRSCHAVELDPAYCDVVVRCWEMATRRTASC